MGMLLNPYIFTDVNTFVSIWDTRLTSTGSSSSNTIVLPISVENMLNLVVDWGDGTINNSNTHTYAEEGVKTVKIKGYIVFNGFNNTGDRLKIREITSWGQIYLSGVNIFRACNNLSLANVAGKPIIGTALGGFLRDNTSVIKINGINTWDTSNCREFSDFARGSSVFNDNIGNWNFTGVTSTLYLQNFMAGRLSSSFSLSNYDALLVGLANQVSGLAPNVNFVMGSIRHTSIGASAKTILSTEKNWTFTDGGETT